MAEFTPGPWHVGGYVQLSNGWTTIQKRPDSDDWVVSSLIAHCHQDNARLIAAAPALYAALEECITDDGAQCIVTGDIAYMIRRFKAINATVRAALALVSTASR